MEYLDNVGVDNQRKIDKTGGSTTKTEKAGRVNKKKSDNQNQRKKLPHNKLERIK